MGTVVSASTERRGGARYKYLTQKVDKRAAAMAKIPEGIKIIGSWVDLAGGRMFEVFEADNPKVVIEATFAWNDLGKIEIVPVMETEEALKLFPKG
jgi:hypothetical protein